VLPKKLRDKTVAVRDMRSDHWIDGSKIPNLPEDVLEYVERTSREKEEIIGGR